MQAADRGLFDCQGRRTADRARDAAGRERGDRPAQPARDQAQATGRRDRARGPGAQPGDAPGSPPEFAVATETGPKAAAPAPIANFDGLDFANWGAGIRPTPTATSAPTYYIQTVNTSIGIFRKSDGVAGGGVHVQHLHEPGQLRQPVRHQQLRRSGRALRHVRGPLDHHRLRVPARRLAATSSIRPARSSASRSRRPAIRSAGGWNYYSINITGGLGDYPKFGIWPDGLYMSANMFGYAAGGAVPERARLGVQQGADVRRQPDRPGRLVRRAGRPTSPSCRATRGCRPARRRPARPTTSSRRWQFLERADRLQVPRRLEQHLALDVHRSRHPARRHQLAERGRAERAVSRAATALDVAADPGDDAEPVHEHRRRRVAVGHAHGAPRQTRPASPRRAGTR